MAARVRWVRGIEVAANASTIVVALVAVWVIFRPAPRPSSSKIPARPLSFIGAHVRGDSRATVGMIIFADFQCPACRQFARARLTGLVQDYVQPGMLVIGFRHSPLAAIHPLAVGAARAAQCAEEQGRFWTLHDVLFERPDLLAIDALTAKSAELGLDPAFASCVARTAPDPQVEADRKLARELGVNATPTVFVGNILQEKSGTFLRVRDVLVGAQAIEKYKVVIQAALGRD